MENRDSEVQYAEPVDRSGRMTGENKIGGCYTTGLDAKTAKFVQYQIRILQFSVGFGTKHQPFAATDLRYMFVTDSSTKKHAKRCII
jgi:hypothetical protein